MVAFTTLKIIEEKEVDEVEKDLYEEVEIIDEKMGGELKEPTLVKMELDKKDPKEEDKKANKEKKQGKVVKR
mgnify:CR=1 FL=1